MCIGIWFDCFSCFLTVYKNDIGFDLTVLAIATTHEMDQSWTKLRYFGTSEFYVFQWLQRELRTQGGDWIKHQGSLTNVREVSHFPVASAVAEEPGYVQRSDSG